MDGDERILPKMSEMFGGKKQVNHPEALQRDAAKNKREQTLSQSADRTVIKSARFGSKRLGCFRKQIVVVFYKNQV